MNSGIEAAVIAIHSLAHAVAALRAAAQAGRAVTLASAPEAGIYAGAGWFAAVVRAAREAAPGAVCSAVLDCGDDPAAALVAIRTGIERVVFIGRADVAERLGAVALRYGVRLETARPPAALDLLDDLLAPSETLEQRCADALASAMPVC